jgi:hypothetical protein
MKGMGWEREREGGDKEGENGKRIGAKGERRWLGKGCAYRVEIDASGRYHSKYRQPLLGHVE